MVKRLVDIPEVEARHLAAIQCPTFGETRALGMVSPDIR